MDDAERRMLALCVAHYLVLPMFMTRDDVEEILGECISEEDFWEFHRHVWVRCEDTTKDFVITLWKTWRKSRQRKDRKKTGAKRLRKSVSGR